MGTRGSRMSYYAHARAPVIVEGSNNPSVHRIRGSPDDRRGSGTVGLRRWSYRCPSDLSLGLLGRCSCSQACVGLSSGASDRREEVADDGTKALLRQGRVAVPCKPWCDPIERHRKASHTPRRVIVRAHGALVRRSARPRPSARRGGSMSVARSGWCSPCSPSLAARRHQRNARGARVRVALLSERDRVS